MKTTPTALRMRPPCSSVSEPEGGREAAMRRGSRQFAWWAEESVRNGTLLGEWVIVDMDPVILLAQQRSDHLFLSRPPLDEIYTHKDFKVLACCLSWRATNNKWDSRMSHSKHWLVARYRDRFHQRKSAGKGFHPTGPVQPKTKPHFSPCEVQLTTPSLDLFKVTY